MQEMVTSHLPFHPIISSMYPRRNRGAQAALLTLEDDAAIARGGFACIFSTSDEYERALISERRAQGRYRQRNSLWPLLLFAGGTAMMASAALLLH
jgi:hypothetical protein